MVNKKRRETIEEGSNYDFKSECRPIDDQKINRLKKIKTFSLTTKEAYNSYGEINNVIKKMKKNKYEKSDFENLFLKMRDIESCHRLNNELIKKRIYFQKKTMEIFK